MSPTLETSAASLDNFVSIAERFHRSVNLPGDWAAGTGIDTYLLTPTVRSLCTRIVAELSTKGGTRAWSVVGPYGAGKSSFALFLTHVLCEDESSRNGNAESIREAADFARSEFTPILVSADRSPLGDRIAQAVASAFEDVDAAVVGDAVDLAARGSPTGAELLQLVQSAAQSAMDHNRGGLVLVVDEFGKYLEYAAVKPDDRDLMFLQTLAEGCARSEIPVLLLTILHQGLADYLPSRNDVHRQEWQKIQGRFREVAFQLPVEQLLVLMSSAIERDMPSDIETAWQETVAQTLAAASLERVRDKIPLESVLAPVLPIHPIAALLLWPIFRSKMAQNERSLFAFLSSREPFGLTEYLEETLWDGDETPPMFGTDRLYDYVDNALALGTFRGEQGRRWAEVRRCLSRLPKGSGHLAEQLVKAIGLLSMYGVQVGLAASEEVLELAVSADRETVREALTLLEEHSIVVYRKHRNAFSLWEGSDVDLEEAYQRGKRETSKAGLAARLKTQVDLRPIVARAHYIQKGTLRYLDAHVLNPDLPAIERVFKPDSQHGDGAVVFVVGLPEEARSEFIEAAAKLTADAQLCLIAVPDDVLGLDASLRELDVWRWVRQNVPALKGDEVARQEVKARISHARDDVEAKAGQVFGLAGHTFRPNLSVWIQGGKTQPPRSTRAFQGWISSLCDDVFHEAPRLHNELLNRQTLSSASSGARRNLIEAMIHHQAETRLGIEGTPAEASMYASLLWEGGFHRERGGQWRFDKPNKEWRATWAFLEDYFASTTVQRKLVSDLFSLLQQPPLGLREGPIPVVFMAFALAHWDECAFYEDGVYVPEVGIEVIERLLARPETFEIQSYSLSDEERSLLASLSIQIRMSGSGAEANAGLLPIVRSLVHQAASLSPFSRRTRNLEPPEALSVRDALLGATSPRELLFEDLPKALDVDVDEPSGVERFSNMLRECMLAINRAYPALLDQVESALRSALDLPDGPAIEAVVALKRRAEPLVEFALEDTLQVFVREAARLGTERDWREALASVVCGGIPPAHWSDKDLTVFQVKLKRVAGSFSRLEELAGEEGVGDESRVVYRLGVLTASFEERRAVVSVDGANREEVSDLAAGLLDHLSNAAQGNGNRNNIRLAALAKASDTLLTNAGEEV